MMDIRSVVVTTAKPSGPGDLGRVAEGFYTVADGILTMCDPDGRPLRDDNTGRRRETKLLPGDDEMQEAKRMTLRFWRENNKDDMAGFHRPIRYPDRGWA
jgi:hypothetical protein